MSWKIGLHVSVVDRTNPKNVSKCAAFSIAVKIINNPSENSGPAITYKMVYKFTAKIEFERFFLLFPSTSSQEVISAKGKKKTQFLPFR